ncbi:MAG: FAD-binding protein, partial [Ktedonobacteraceae bacterium]|nr:FAD-binding protein [Ktedonobacteraceae bacterium]
MDVKQGKYGITTFDTEQVNNLRKRTRGGVLLPEDEGYDQARQTWDVKTFDQHPAMIILPASTSDVQTAVTFARAHHLPIGVQGGGHGHPYPVNNALLVNFANMTRIQIYT